jgi:catechol 2,3-dioxygenase-like lactoylglutathione lyase family enzyme
VILRLHHATLRVADVDEALARWSLLYGLSGERAGAGALLRCGYEDYALELVPAGGAAAGLEHVAWELRPGVSLDEVEARVRAHGAEPQRVEVPLHGDGLRVADPEGNANVVLPHYRRPDPRPPIARDTATLPGYRPRRLQHVNYLTTDTPRIVRWYEEALGFTITDWIGDDACWLHVGHDHHVLAFLDKGFAHVHHLAFEVTDFGEIRNALDHLGQHGRWVTWGPGRHAMAQNLFAYIRMPEEELFVELFCDMEQLDGDHVPRHFPDTPRSSNAWGVLPPRSYFRFDAEAIASEREQREALGPIADPNRASGAAP